MAAKVDMKKLVDTAMETAAAIGRETDVPAIAGADAVRRLLHDHDNFIIDCDGVLYTGGVDLPRAKEAIAMLRRLGKRVVFVTNTSSKSREMAVKSLRSRGIEATLEDTVTTASAVADYVSTELPDVRKVYCVGAQGINDEMAKVGIEVLGGGGSPHTAVTSFTEAEFDAIKIDPEVGAVVCGWDLTFNFYKMSYASLCIQRGAHFVATNRDAFDKLTNGMIPGNGAAVSSIEVATGQRAINVGKPTKWLSSRVLESRGLDPARTVMIGDRIDTDILFGNNGGMSTVMVLTGTCGEEDIVGMHPDDCGRPDAVMGYLGFIADVGLSDEAGLACATARAPVAAPRAGAGAEEAPAAEAPRSKL